VGNPAFLAGFQKDCAGCHVSCGDCHISSPKNVGGGLIRAHRVNRTPDMVKNCTACHGSRIGDEYYGNNDYAGADVHRVPHFMDCMDCHTGDEMHGDGSRPQHRYEVANMVRCEDCHADVESANAYHNVHWGDMSCQVCHSQTYKGCNGCHVGEGITGSSYPIFKIGRTTRPQDRPIPYQLLRHVPVAVDTYEGWGLDNLDDFAAVPTWKLTTPHNIRRWTERTEVAEGGSCGSVCHTSQEWFLRAADLEGLSEAERQANLPYIVPDGPPTSWPDE
jgi:thiosulfate/3-mercaptopyruvate sulfurtransferase